MGRFGETIKYVDFIGLYPTLMKDGSNRNKTLLGGILSICTGLTIIASAIYFSMMLFNWSNFTVIRNEEKNYFPYKNWTDGEISFLVVDNS
jgi:hypothetical protein